MSDRKGYFYLLILASVFGIAIATLSPFNFIIPSTISLGSISQEFHHATNIKDYVRNILLFVPLGIGYGGSFKKQKQGAKYLRAILFYSLLLGAVISCAIELTQILLPGRVSSISDIVCNSIGCSVGAILYSLHRQIGSFVAAIINKQYSQIDLLSLLVIIYSYGLVLIIGNLLIIGNSNLSNWNKDYHLAIASEVEGTASWDGYLTNLYISDRSLNRLEVKQAFNQTHRFFLNLPSLVAAFVLVQKQTSYRDYGQQIPNLVWQPDSQLKLDDIQPINNYREPNSKPEKNLLLNYRYSLITEAVPRAIATKIQRSNQFTISLTCATNSFDQVGPARIVTYAGSLSKRNLIIAQRGKDLIVFLRTPITGVSGNEPNFAIPNVFDDDDFHQIVITFRENELTVYIDELTRNYNFKFNLATAGKLYLPWQNANWRIDLTQVNLAKANVKFYSAACFPLTILVVILIAKLLSDGNFG